jgi:hypothetical protein
MHATAAVGTLTRLLLAERGRPAKVRRSLPANRASGAGAGLLAQGGWNPRTPPPQSPGRTGGAAAR